MSMTLNESSKAAIESKFSHVIHKSSFSHNDIDEERAILKALFKKFSTLYEKIRKEKIEAKKREGAVDSPGILPSQSSEASVLSMSCCSTFVSERKLT